MLSIAFMSGRFTDFDPSVNGYLTGCPSHLPRSTYRAMDLSSILDRVEQRLITLKISADKASRLAGKTDAIRNMRRALESGDRHGVTTATLSALAPVLKTTVAWLMTGEGDPERLNASIVGFAGAGGDQVYFAEGQGPFGEVPAPEGSTEKTVAVEVRGNSLGHLLNGWIMFYDDLRDPPTLDMLGSLCIVALTDGRVLVKSLHAGQLPRRFNLLSNGEPPIYDARVDWAAKIKAMMPK